MKTVLCTWMISIMALTVFAQSGELSGQVTNEEGEAVPFANVSLKVGEELIRVVATDFEGYYIMKPISPGKYDVVISTIAYASVEYKDVRVSNGQLLTLNTTLGMNLMTETVIDGYNIIGK